MTIFNSYVKLPEGTMIYHDLPLKSRDVPVQKVYQSRDVY